MSHSLSALQELVFDNRLVRELPADAIADNYRRQVTGAAYSLVKPTPVRAPTLLAAASDVLQLLDLPAAIVEDAQFTQVFAGNQLLPGMAPHACCYGGHQFGNWAGQLGDGRAINLGEVRNAKGEHWTLQLKGAGPTPYSRTADGLAVLRSSLREFLCSEAMHHLGVPTTRALSLITTGEQVRRDMFYNGNPAWEPGAVVCRVAPSFTRFGNFELAAARGDQTLLRQWADFTIRSDFAALLSPAEARGEPLGREAYVRWFETVCTRTAELMAHWMRVGFVHGVMNTDNMSILGLTIDYGPYGWLEGYDPNWTPNTTDGEGRRYAYGRQPSVALWNLAQLGNAIYPLVGEVAPLQQGLARYREAFALASSRDMAGKLGLREFLAPDEALADTLLQTLQLSETDMTIFYRLLGDYRLDDLQQASDSALLAALMPAYYGAPNTEAAAAMVNWLRRYGERVQQDFIMHGDDDNTRRARMNAVNPKYVLRNYMAQQAIDAASEGDTRELATLLAVLRNPYSEQPEYQRYFAKRPEWARDRAGCSMLSCSS